MAAVTGKALDRKLLGRVFGYVRPYKQQFWTAASLTIVMGVLGPLRPYLIQVTLDDYILNYDAEGLKMMTMLMVAVLVVEAVIQFAQTYMANWLGQSVIRDLRMQVYRKIVNFKLRYFDQTAIGTLVTRAVSDIETIADIFSQGILIIFGDILKLVLVITIMFWMDWRLTLVSLVTLPLIIWSTVIFKNAIKSAFQDVRTNVSKLNAFVQEHITGMNIVQIFNREKQEAGKFREINADHREAHIRSVWAYSIFFPIVEIFSATALALLIWWGANGVIEGVVTFGNLVAFILYIYMLFRPIRQLADRFNTLQMGMVGSERVFKVLDTEAEIEDAGTTSGAAVNGNIAFRNVWFSYNDALTNTASDDENWVLRDVSFDVRSGETLAMVGATGAGKSSIINLLNRFYEYQRGTIAIDGTDLRDFQLDALRERIGVVLQDVFLFSDSIHNNITLNNPNISREQVVEAAKIVGADDFIRKLPGGYDYDVKERGAMLSVGQRQLIAFIRAYVYNPAVLVLDEATSSVDSESEELIQHAIGKLTEGRTSIVIAHRLATIQSADTILVMDQGKIVEQGSHRELLELGGAYKTLFELQFKDSA